MKVSQLLGSWGPWCVKCPETLTASAIGTMALQSLFIASGSWQSEDLFSWSFSVAWHIRHLNGYPGWGRSLLLGTSGT